MSTLRRPTAIRAVGVLAVCMVVVLAGCRPPGDDAAPPGPLDHLPRTIVTIDVEGGATVEVDAWVAETVTERRRGLMGITHLADGEGMLFAFEDDRRGGFWMFETLIALDIAFIDADGLVGTILGMDPCASDDPDDCPVYTPANAYRFALEVPQGWFEATGVREGDSVQFGEVDRS